MKYLDFNPIGNIIQPIGLYNNLKEKRSIILFSKYDANEDKWGFDEKFNDMDLEDIYYVFSPSITPMPPSCRIFKINTTDSPKKYTESITHIMGIYDINGIIANKGNSPTDVIFCTYTRQFEDIVSLNIFIDKDEDNNFSLYMTSKKDAFETPDRFFGYKNTVRQIFVMKNYSNNFEKNNLNMCVPTKNNNHSKQTIQDCIKSLDVYDHPIERLWDYIIKNEENTSKKNDKNINIIIISFTVVISLILLILIYMKIKK